MKVLFIFLLVVFFFYKFAFCSVDLKKLKEKTGFDLWIGKVLSGELIVQKIENNTLYFVGDVRSKGKNKYVIKVNMVVSELPTIKIGNKIGFRMIITNVLFDVDKDGVVVTTFFGIDQEYKLKQNIKLAVGKWKAENVSK